jgi:hypothetical protein
MQRHREKLFDLAIFFSASQRLCGGFLVFRTLSNLKLVTGNL